MTRRRSESRDAAENNLAEALATNVVEKVDTAPEPGPTERPRRLAEILPELRGCVTSHAPESRLLGNVRADEMTRAVDAALLLLRAGAFLEAQVPIAREDTYNGSLRCPGCGAQNSERCRDDCWADELEGLVEEIREAGQ